MGVRRGISLLMLVLLAALVGCSADRVRPWERGNLAQPVMVPDGGVQHRAFVEHFYASKEATAGGYGLGAGGCGCK